MTLNLKIHQNPSLLDNNNLLKYIYSTVKKKLRYKIEIGLRFTSTSKYESYKMVIYKLLNGVIRFPNYLNTTKNIPIPICIIKEVKKS